MSLRQDNLVHLCVWSGEPKAARALVRSRFPLAQVEEFPHRKLRISSFVGRVRLMRSLRGQAVVFYFASLAAFRHTQIVACIHLLHGCRETILCDQTGRWRTIRNSHLLQSVPGVLTSLFRDGFTLLRWWIYLKLLPARPPVPLTTGKGNPQVAYLIPNLADMGSAGGAISHIRGFLYGLRAGKKTCRVFTGTTLQQNAFQNEIIQTKQRPYVFWGAVMLAYNLAFVQGAENKLAGQRPGVFYQRHLAFSVAGALLSRRMQIPLILEYNGSEFWVAKHWDPSPLRAWIKLCEDLTLRHASRVVVVSEALKEELLHRGLEPQRIRVNPNGVDPDFFRPGPGREPGRKELGISDEEVAVGFVGSFSFWHGIEVLQRAITLLLQHPQPCRLRFILVGDGLLHGEMRSALAAYEQAGQVIFTGSEPREKVVTYLDAADILVSPHVPMPDGSRFFGSPTKLFEYMAMGKGIVASRLEQIAEVLQHEQTALLVTPGSADELAAAILRLAIDPHKRAALGAAARRRVMERYTWAHNVAAALNESAAVRDPYSLVL